MSLVKPNVLLAITPEDEANVSAVDDNLYCPISPDSTALILDAVMSPSNLALDAVILPSDFNIKLPVPAANPSVPR